MVSIAVSKTVDVSSILAAPAKLNIKGYYGR